jgi:ABC-type branched-subunit amino acid transport system substrate-binding protein
MKRSMRIAAAAAVGSLGLAIAACGSSGSASTTGAATSAYHVGINIDLSSSLAFQGNPFREGFLTYMQAKNRSGGINGHQVDVTALDDQNTINTAISNTQQLAQADHVSVQVGMLNSAEGVAVKSTVERLKLPSIVTYTSASANGDYEWGIDSPISEEPRAQVEFAATLMSKANVTKPRVAFLTAVTPVLANWLALAKNLVASKGWDVVANQQVPLTATDLTAADKAIASAKPNIVLMAVPGNQAIIAVRDYTGDGLNVPVLEHTSGGTVATFSALKDPNYYALVSDGIPGVDNEPGVKAEITNAKLSHTQATTTFFSNGYANGVVVANILAKCPGSCTSQQFQTTMENYGTMQTDGVTVGPLSFTSSYHAGVQYVREYHWDTAQQLVAASGLLSIRP